MSITIREATTEDAPIVGELAYKLVCEIAPEAIDSISLESYRSSAADLLARKDRFWALLAEAADGEAVGLVTLNECAAIYAGGRFGEIPELFVAPSHRSQGVASSLLRAAGAFARRRDWSRLEVGAPDQPRWQRTVKFYLREGFVEVGPRLKYLL